jgi:hypothetical protein
MSNCSAWAGALRNYSSYRLRVTAENKKNARTNAGMAGVDAYATKKKEDE